MSYWLLNFTFAGMFLYTSYVFAKFLKDRNDDDDDDLY